MNNLRLNQLPSDYLRLVLSKHPGAYPQYQAELERRETLSRLEFKPQHQQVPDNRTVDLSQYSARQLDAYRRKLELAPPGPRLGQVTAEIERRIYRVECGSFREETNDRAKALAWYTQCVAASEAGWEKLAHETVTLEKDGQILRQHEGEATLKREAAAHNLQVDRHQVRPLIDLEVS